MCLQLRLSGNEIILLESNGNSYSIMERKKHCTFISVLFCSFISFIYTDPKSPDDLEDTCFNIDNTSVSIMHYGNFLKIFFDYFLFQIKVIFSADS